MDRPKAGSTVNIVSLKDPRNPEQVVRQIKHFSNKELQEIEEMEIVDRANVKIRKGLYSGRVMLIVFNGPGDGVKIQMQKPLFDIPKAPSLNKNQQAAAKRHAGLDCMILLIPLLHTGAVSLNSLSMVCTSARQGLSEAYQELVGTWGMADSGKGIRAVVESACSLQGLLLRKGPRFQATLPAFLGPVPRSAEAKDTRSGRQLAPADFFASLAYEKACAAQLPLEAVADTWMLSPGQLRDVQSQGARERHFVQERVLLPPEEVEALRILPAVVAAGAAQQEAAAGLDRTKGASHTEPEVPQMEPLSEYNLDLDEKYPLAPLDPPLSPLFKEVHIPRQKRTNDSKQRGVPAAVAAEELNVDKAKVREESVAAGEVGAATRAATRPDIDGQHTSGGSFAATRPTLELSRAVHLPSDEQAAHTAT
ncbi:hypothetical protein WJX73_010902 [Symbiochloris irregularis]|uniref:Uncharacterized protein n=1 Tax=Symbiochloris irregularis TaxID=706552 RepID=A0AAW1NX12_9CHLO